MSIKIMNDDNFLYVGIKVLASTKKLKINSLIDIDLLTDSKKRPILLEINPRPSGSLVTSYMAGIPILSLEIANILNLNYKYNSKNRLLKKIKF